MTFRYMGKLALWFVVGAAVGTAVAILVAPHAGRDARRLLVKTARKAAETSREVLETGRELIEKTNEVVQASLKAANA